MLSYADSVVHFCFDSGVARSINIGPFILLLSVHAEQDGFSVVCVRRKNGDNIQPWKDGDLFWEEHHLQTQRFSVHDNKFICIWEQYQELPFRHDELWGFQCEQEDTPSPYRESLRPGQSSTLLEHRDNEASRAYRSRYPTDDPLIDEWWAYCEYSSLSLSLEADDQITVHFHPKELDFRYAHANLDYSARGPGLIYCLKDMENSAYLKNATLCIGRESSELLHVRDAKACRFEYLHETLFPRERWCISVWGDGDFVIFPVDDQIWIWCFDEAWLPSGIPNMRVATW